MSRTVGAARLVTGDEILVDHQVRIENGCISAIEPCSETPKFDLLTAGFVDLQVNGHDDVDVSTATGADWDRLDDQLIAQGVTSWCPTLVTAPLEVLDQRMREIGRAATRPGPRPEIIGIHLEGPFLGRAHGAHQGVDETPIDHDWLAELPDLVRLVTLGPEREGSLEAIRALSARGVVVALGHTTADYDTTISAVDAGARLFTHAFNASGPLHHRQPGALGAALSDDRLTVSLIADGHHVHPAVLGLAWRAKPAGQVALVTDATAWRSGRLGEVGISMRDGAPRLGDGTLAGSSLTMGEAVRYSVNEVGVDLGAALRAASAVPAALLGLDDRGDLTVGRRADLVALDGQLGHVATWIAGERCRDFDAQPGGSGS